MTKWPLICIRIRALLHSLRATYFWLLPQPSTMDADSKRQKRRDNALLLLGAAIEAMNLAKEISSPTPAKAVFGSVSILLTMIRVCYLLFSDHSSFTCNQDSMANKTDYVDLGIICADVCRALERGTNGKGPDDLNQSVREAIAQLKT